MSLSQSLYQKQELKISPQLLQGLNVLQLNQLELTDYLKKKIEDNIFLEEEISDQNNLQSNNKEIFEESLYYKPSKNSSLSTSDIIERVTKQQEKLIESLLQQARIQYQKQDIEYKICQYLISSIDSHGFLSREDFLETSKDLQCEQNLIEKVRKEINNFNPLGMCCFDIRDFLILQVEVKKKNPILISMLQDDYHHVMKKEHAILTKKYNLSKEQLKEIFTSLSFLDIYPNSFQQQEIQYINPDVTLTKEKEQFFISINEEFFPKIKVDHEMHENFSQQKKNMQDENYYNLQKDYQEAKSLISSINYRKTNLLKVIHILLKEQKDFFQYGIQFIKPYTLEKLSQETNLSISTLSRLSHSKYISTPWGIFSFAIFFSRNIGDEKTSSIKMKEMIKEILKEYDGEKKLSDQKVSNLLEKKGYSVARRTINKYRKQLNILSSVYR